MMRYVLGFLFIPLSTLLFLSDARGQSMPPRAFIQPAQVLLPIGQSQIFQLLQSDGNESVSSDWTLSDPDIAELRIEGNHVIVTAKATGHVTLSNSSGARAAELEVHDGLPPMPPESRWILQPINGRFAQALWASTTWGGTAPNADPVGENTPSYFYEDRGPAGAHIRAIREDGLQVWQWPESYSMEVPRMVCGDSLGGVLLQIGEKESRILVDLDATGHERWRSPVPGFTGKDFTYTLTGGVYFFGEHPNMRGGRIVGLDAHDGVQKFAFELPESQEELHGLEIRNGELVCSPGQENLTPLPSRHSHMLTNAEGVANFAYSEFNLIAEAVNCSAGSVLTPMQVQVKVTQRLVIVDVHEDGSSSTSIVEQNTEAGAAGDTWIQASVPTGDIIPGEEGTGNFLAVRRTKQLWRGTGPGTIEEFQYRINDDRTVKYRFPVPVSPPGFSSTMLLGENNLGYTTRGKTVLAFNTETGKEIWRWESTKSTVLACAALKDNEVMVHEGGGYAILKDGQVVDRREEAYMLFVMKFRPDWESF
jgi:outer membrane protein assembly factor BamB